jgi:hypothetical protein
MLRVKNFLRALLQGMKPGFIVMNQKPKPIHGMATHILSCQENVQVSTLCRETYADIVRGYEWTNSQTLSGERRDSQQYKEQHHSARKTEACNSQ